MANRKVFDRITDVLSDTARRKMEAARSRFKPLDRSGDYESPRDVYLNACTDIASSFEGEGYRYAKSGPHLTRKTDALVYRIAFQSSHNNVVGQQVVLWMHASVASPQLKAWRTKISPASATSGHAAGGMVHLLTNDHAMVQWELADLTNRADVINDAVAFIRSDVLPYFSLFSDPQAVVQSLKERSIPAMWLVDQVEFALCFGSHEDGQRVLDRFVMQRRDLREAITRAEAEGLPRTGLRPNGYAEEVAFLRRTYDLK